MICHFHEGIGASMRREEVAGRGIGAIKATSANGWSRREKVEDGDIGAIKVAGRTRGRGVCRRRAETLAQEK